MEATLYSYWRSSCSWRVRIALAYKNIHYTTVPINLLHSVQSSEEYTAKNFMAQVPTLKLGDLTLTQSLAIFHYLEDEYSPSMLPTESFTRARMWEICEIINSGTQPLQNLAILQEIERLGGDKKAWSQKVITKGLKAVETILEETAGTYCVGDRLTFADACLVPQVYNAMRFEVNMEEFPIVHRVYQSLLEHSAVQAAHPDNQPDAQVS